MRTVIFLLFGAGLVVAGISLLKPSSSLLLGPAAFIFVGCILIFVAGLLLGGDEAEAERSHDPTA